MNRYELLRFEHGLTRGEVSKTSGVSESTLARLEAGQITKPAAATVKALADVYGVTVSELLGLDDKAAA